MYASTDSDYFTGSANKTDVSYHQSGSQLTQQTASLDSPRAAKYNVKPLYCKVHGGYAFCMMVFTFLDIMITVLCSLQNSR